MAKNGALGLLIPPQNIGCAEIIVNILALRYNHNIGFKIGSL